MHPFSIYSEKVRIREVTSLSELHASTVHLLRMNRVSVYSESCVSTLRLLTGRKNEDYLYSLISKSASVSSGNPYSLLLYSGSGKDGKPVSWFLFNSYKRKQNPVTEVHEPVPKMEHISQQTYKVWHKNA